jgi:hypothetical protein
MNVEVAALIRGQALYDRVPIGVTPISFKCHNTLNCVKGWKCYELALSDYVNSEVTG